MIIFSGGTGTPKLLNGLRKVIPEENLTVVVNTAEDLWVSGNLVTPDIDTVLYLLSNRIDSKKWWGVADDTFRTYELMKSLGHNEKMMLGDLDRATHIMRSDHLRAGKTLSTATMELSRSFGVAAKVLPMSDDPVSTMVVTPGGTMHFQDFWLGNQGKPEVLDVYQDGVDEASISPAVLEELDNEDEVLIGPSNPITSIGPILAIPGMRDILRKKKVIAVSPIIGTEPVSGPAGKLMSARGMDVSSVAVAQFYKDFLDVFVIDERDNIHDQTFDNLDCKVMRADTLMKTVDVSLSLSKFVVDEFGKMD
ncbi:2-phospho-L-lactate transferase [Methanolobus sp. ZRKC3]|uniref:2-phospho-L-lactate transferase n=1 Tax=Methanolobus sp. ZRKC3 TaxID=3125786 RepID=UPI00325052C8